MKPLVAFACLLLAGCSQEYLDERNARRDDAACTSMGVTPGDQQYFDCRMQMARIRLNEQNMKSGLALGMIGAGQNISRQPQTSGTGQITCIQQGSFLNCR